ncbi:Panacea domain-containing protein [Flavihumibacter sp. ZG627]|uniref:Panacea domain-containing protein n=1 Tax=Flavihumibacter sp. ZG627 TaxID=1463156 RepID=UPI000A8219E5|nr:Panacea domain-containing protein [Flavihumibacter sp. ZG627]
MKGFNYKKSVQALALIALSEQGVMNKMKAIKLIWLADRLHLRRYGRTITGDTYFALKLGPIASNTRDILEASSFASDEETAYSNNFIKQEGKNYYRLIGDFNAKVFSKTDVEVLKMIIAEYGKMDQFDLSDFSHRFPEWKKWELELKRGNPSRYPMEIEDFFIDPVENPKVFQEDPEMLENIKDIFLKKHYSEDATTVD